MVSISEIVDARSFLQFQPIMENASCWNRRVNLERSNDNNARNKNTIERSTISRISFPGIGYDDSLPSLTSTNHRLFRLLVKRKKGKSIRNVAKKFLPRSLNITKFSPFSLSRSLSPLGTIKREIKGSTKDGRKRRKG